MADSGGTMLKRNSFVNGNAYKNQNMIGQSDQGGRIEGMFLVFRRKRDDGLWLQRIRKDSATMMGEGDRHLHPSPPLSLSTVTMSPARFFPQAQLSSFTNATLANGTLGNTAHA